MKNRILILDHINDKINSIYEKINLRCAGQNLSKEQVDNIKKENPFELPEDFLSHERDIAKLSALNDIKQFLVSDGMFFLIKGFLKEHMVVLFTDSYKDLIDINSRFDAFPIADISKLNDLDCHKYVVIGLNVPLSEVDYIDNNTFISVSKFYD